MKKIIHLSILLMLMLTNPSAYAQCPDLLQAMVNSCSSGNTEGNNEFVVFTTASTSNVSTYKLNYGTANPPVTNSLSGSDATLKSGTGTVSTSGGCAIVEVTSPATSIPANSRVLFIPANFDQTYDLTGLCNGTNPIYVVYINTNSIGGANSNWSATGTMANSATTLRYLQVTYSGSANCNGTNAPVKSYLATGNWPNISGTTADGNFVTWNGTTAGYYNNGCTTIIVPVKIESFSVRSFENQHFINWTTSVEINTEKYVIERSQNGKDFLPITNIPAALNSSLEKKYTFTDYFITGQPLFYRLKSIDINGHFEYSNIIKTVAYTKGKGNCLITPMPVNNSLQVNWLSASSGVANLVILNINGSTVYSKQIAFKSGMNQASLSASQLSKGMYVFKIINDKEVISTTFIK